MITRSASVLAAAIFLFLLHMILLGSSAPRLRTAVIHLPAWPADTPPVRIALMADLHVAAPSDTPDHLGHVVDRINAMSPDLILIAGDFISSRSIVTRDYTIEAATRPLGSLHARLGTVAVPRQP